MTDEVFTEWGERHTRGKCIFTLHDLHDYCLHICSWERQMTSRHLEKSDTNCVEVKIEAVTRLFEEFRSHESHRARHFSVEEIFLVTKFSYQTEVR